MRALVLNLLVTRKFTFTINKREKRMIRCIAAYLSGLAFTAIIFANSVYAQMLSDVEEAEIAVKVERLLSQMTLEEKVGQMRIFHAIKGVSASVDDKLVLSDDVKQRLKNGIAGIKNPGEFLTPDKAALHTNKLQKYILENTRLKIPALFVTEAYNGVDAHGTTRFGRPMNMAATWNTELVERVWDTIGREARLRGLHMCHSPEADIMRDPRFGRMSEAYSEDTHLTTEMVVAAVNGVQGRGKGLAQGTHIGAVTKHFAGYGQVEGGLNFASVQVSPRAFIDEILPPFKAAVQRAGSLGIMASHGDINGVAAHGSRKLLTELLRDDWGFKGYTVSDSNDIARLFFFMGVAENADAAALMGLNAGVDIDLYSDVAYSQLPRLARENPKILPQIDQAVRRVLRAKYVLGLFDNPYIDVANVAANVRNTASLALAHEADLESVILLKNDNQTLPIKRAELEGKTVGLIGPVMGENTAKQFKQVFGEGVNLVVEQGFELTNRSSGKPALLSDEVNAEGLNKAVDAASKADVVVLFLGGDEFTSKEAYFAHGLGDRASIDPVGLQDELITQVKALGKPVIVALKHRRTLSINTIAQQADAILDAWELSERGDLALAHLILGDANPSGKLPVTVPRSIGQLPFHYSQKNINFKKHYLFTQSGPLYPFGYGLSYTDFKYSGLKLSAKKIKNDESLNVTVKITNKGRVPGKEVVQLYIQDVIGSVTRPAKELKAFKKITLAPGKSQKVTFKITPEMLTFTNVDMNQVVEPGDFVVEVGTSSAKTMTAQFKVVD